MKREPLPTCIDPPPVKYADEGARIYVCVACRDTGYRAVVVEHGHGEKRRDAAALCPCSCEYGGQVRANLDACARAEEPKHRVPHVVVRCLPYGPYDTGRDESDPRVS